MMQLHKPKEPNLITESHYKGLPIDASKGPYCADQLQCACNTIDTAMSKSNRLIQVCFTLQLPQEALTWLDQYTNNALCKFLRNLQGWALKTQQDRAHGRSIKRRARIDYLWRKEMDNNQPVYRVMLLLNPEAYYKQSLFADDHNLLYRMHISWAKAIQAPKHVAEKLLRPSGKLIAVTGNDMDEYLRVFEKASLLCRTPSTDAGLGSQGFGSSVGLRKPRGL